MGMMPFDQRKDINFFFMRHAQGVDGAHGLVPYGTACRGLTQAGVKQVLSVAQEIMMKQGLVPNTVFASPIRRAMATAEIIADILKAPLIELPEAREHELGDWEGKPWQEIADKFEVRVDPPNGEPYAAFYARIGQCLDRVVEVRGPVLLVAHGGIWHGLKALHGDTQTDWLPQACFCSVSIKEGKMISSREYTPEQAGHIVAPREFSRNKTL